MARFADRSESWCFAANGFHYQDVKFGARILLRSPGITLAVILALTLGIGANSAMFSIVDALLLHPLPLSRSRARSRW